MCTIVVRHETAIFSHRRTLPGIRIRRDRTGREWALVTLYGSLCGESREYEARTDEVLFGGVFQSRHAGAENVLSECQS